MLLGDLTTDADDESIAFLEHERRARAQSLTDPNHTQTDFHNSTDSNQG